MELSFLHKITHDIHIIFTSYSHHFHIIFTSYYLYDIHLMFTRYICTGYVQDMYRIWTGYVQDIHTWCSHHNVFFSFRPNIMFTHWRRITSLRYSAHHIIDLLKIIWSLCTYSIIMFYNYNCNNIKYGVPICGRNTYINKLLCAGRGVSK